MINVQSTTAATAAIEKERMAGNGPYKKYFQELQAFDDESTAHRDGLSSNDGVQQAAAVVM